MPSRVSRLAERGLAYWPAKRPMRITGRRAPITSTSDIWRRTLSVLVEELAEPVPDRPRILEVPDVAPPAPALGGILIEPAEEPMESRRPGFEVPLQCAPRLPRLLAATTDGVLVLLATAMFGWIFFKITATVPPLRQLMVL